MQYLNTKTNAYETAAEHFDYKFDHDKSNCVAWSYEGLKDYADENGCDVDKMVADGIIEVDYEDGNWYIDPADDGIVWDYLIDEDETSNDDEDDDNDDDETEYRFSHDSSNRIASTFAELESYAKAYDYAMFRMMMRDGTIEVDYEDGDWYIDPAWEDPRDDDDEDEDDELMVYISDVQHETMDMQAAIDEDAEGRAEYYGFDRLRHSVTIHEEESPDDEDGIQVSLSWSSIGAVTIDEAEEFVKILQKAIDEGRRACCTGMHVTYDMSEANYSPYGTTDDDKDTEDTEDMHESYEALKAALERDYETGRELAYFIDAEEPDIEVEDIYRVVDEMVTEKNRIVERFNADLKADLERAVMLDHNSYILMRAGLELEFWDETAREYEDDDEELPF